MIYVPSVLLITCILLGKVANVNEKRQWPEVLMVNFTLDENLTEQAHLARNLKNCKHRSEKICTNKMLNLHTVKPVVDEELPEVIRSS